MALTSEGLATTRPWSMQATISSLGCCGPCPAATHMELVVVRGNAVVIGVGAGAPVTAAGAAAIVIEPKRWVQRDHHCRLHLS